ncbi:RNA polymerase sigma factor [Streptomyces sp. NPDC092296]|uniref:RNA polymerase sigma factor n=1 Tax=Streptomyces sp. NPDC092296 TaxID=3366012 RepID=UPI003817772F
MGTLRVEAVPAEALQVKARRAEALRAEEPGVSDVVGVSDVGPGAAPEERPPPWEAAAALMPAAQRGDVLAMDALLRLLTPYVTRLCRPIALRDTADAVQEALVAVFRGLHTVQEPGALYGWVRTVTVREAVRVARRAARETPVAEWDDRPARGDPQLAGEVYDVLRRMSSDHRAILVLRELEGLDEQAASELLGVSRGTVKSRLHRARDSFRKAWQR